MTDSSHTPPTGSQTEKPSFFKKVGTWCKKHPILTVFIVFIVVGAANATPEDTSGSRTSNTSASIAAEEAPKEYVEISCSDFVDIFGLSSSLSNLQKDERFKQYQDKYVQWTGKVSHIDEVWGQLSVQVKCSNRSLVSDTTITFQKDQKEKLLTYNENDNITFDARLDDWGQVMNTSLKDGVVME